MACALDQLNQTDVNGTMMPTVKYAIASIVLDPTSEINAKWTYDSANSRLVHTSGFSMSVGDPTPVVVGSLIIGCGIIVSRYADSKWRRSTCILGEMNDMTASGYTDAYFEECIASYMDAPTAAESSKQLNQASTR